MAQGADERSRRHPERSAAESRDPVERPESAATKSFRRLDGILRLRCAALRMTRCHETSGFRLTSCGILTIRKISATQPQSLAKSSPCRV